jgi:hypothetical protein
MPLAIRRLRGTVEFTTWKRAEIRHTERNNPYSDEFLPRRSQTSDGDQLSAGHQKDGPCAWHNPL